VPNKVSMMKSKTPEKIDSEVKVILDTNILMVPEQFNVDVFSEIDRIMDSEYSILIPDSIINELKELSRSARGKDKRAAKIGLMMADDHKTAETESVGDDAVIELALSIENTVVATNDKELKEKLREKGIPLIYLRQGSHLIKEF